MGAKKCAHSLYFLDEILRFLKIFFYICDENKSLNV